MAYTYVNAKNQKFYLYTQDVTLRGSGRKQRIYYFKKNLGENALDDVPQGYTVVENQRTGLPVLKKTE